MAVVAPRRSLAGGGRWLELEPLELFGPEGPIAAPRRELLILSTLAEAAGKTISKERLLTRSRGTGTEVSDKAIEVCVSRLRRRLAPLDVGIAVIRGIGHRLETGG